MKMKVNDPVGNEILIPKYFLSLKLSGQSTDEIFDDISTVIEKPMMMFEAREHPKLLHYLRAVGWSTIVLVTAGELSSVWEVIYVGLNPSSEQMEEIYDKAFRLK